MSTRARLANARRPARGFTLIEVVIAFVILAGGLTALLRLFTGGMQSAVAADEFARATTYAQSRLAVAGSALDLPAGETSGDEDDANYRWRVQVEDLPDPVPPENPTAISNLRVEMKQVTAVVNVGNREVRLSTLRVMPKKAGQP